jgi:hypothetical protein
MTPLKHSISSVKPPKAVFLFQKIVRNRSRAAKAGQYDYSGFRGLLP